MKKCVSFLVIWMAMILVMFSANVLANTDTAESTTIPAQTKKFKPGLYHEATKNAWKTINIEVDLAEDHVKAIKATNPEVLTIPKPDGTDLVNSFNQVVKNMVEENSPYVDSVTGATHLSDDLKKIVYNVMLKAKNEAIINDGGNPYEPSVDVLVIGSGGAGLAAAIQAHDQGAKVLVVEKMPVIGGNTNKASAGMNAAETKFQERAGIKDQKKLFYEETLKAGQNKNNPELLKYFVDHAPAAIDWLDDHGIELSNLTTTGGMSVDRTHRPADRSAVGGFLVSGLLKNINKRGIEILLSTSAKEILQDNGVVTGVKVFDEDNKKEYVIKTKAVVVATGGFSANLAMVEKYRPELKGGFITTNHKGATGAGIEMLEKIGAGTVDMNEIQIHPTVEQKSAYLISESVRGGGAILLSQAGKRFVNELDTRDKVSKAILELPEKYAYVVFDQQVREENKAIEEYGKKRLGAKEKTLAELAGRLGIDPGTLEESINRYNTFVKQKDDKDFGRTTGMRHPLNKGPFYAIKIAPGIHYTMGGVTINTKTEVLDKDKKVIKGAYAAGEVVGGLHGANRVGGNSVADIVIFGLEAGTQAARYSQGK